MEPKSIALDIFRKRLLIEGYFSIEVNGQTILEFFQFLTQGLSLKTYADPIIHSTNGVGKDVNQGYDAFVPLIDSGIYIGVWNNKKFLSLILYTCKEFNEEKALELTKSFFSITYEDHKIF